MPKQSKRPSRTQRRESLLNAAARTELPPAADVCVVGGGAAGLVGAICAAERLAGATNARVIVLEGALECGQTILATGNGRCNFTNAHLDPTLYNDPAFVRAVTGITWLEDVVGFFEQSGLAWEQEDGGRLYPMSRQAASVRNVLLLRAREAGVVLATAREVTRIDKSDKAGKAFVVTYREKWDAGRTRTLAARHVVVATGGGVPALCEGLGLASTPFEPVLCPLACEGPALASIDGRRVRADVTLMRNTQVIACEKGEVLFRSYGLSGIVMFDLSRHALPGDELVLDLLPALTPQTVRERARHTLDGLLDPLVAQALLAEAGTMPAAIELARCLRYRVTGKAETERAQVSRGGMITSEFDPTTLEARQVPGLFACGEALNVDGLCGGFNLAWAWKSGMVAGSAAAEEVSV